MSIRYINIITIHQQYWIGIWYRTIRRLQVSVLRLKMLDRCIPSLHPSHCRMMIRLPVERSYWWFLHPSSAVYMLKYLWASYQTQNCFPGTARWLPTTHQGCSLHSVQTPWQVIIECTVGLNNSSVSDTFKILVKEHLTDSVETPYHILCVYAWFVDVTNYHLQNSLPINILTELGRLHYRVLNVVQKSILEMIGC